MLCNGFLTQKVSFRFGTQRTFLAKKPHRQHFNFPYIAGGPSPKGGLRMTVLNMTVLNKRRITVERSCRYAVAAVVDARLFIVLRHSSKS